jgi:hypothetical protein
MQLLSPSTAIYGSDGTLLFKMNVPNTYVEGELILTFTSIAEGSVPIRHTYNVPFSHSITQHYCSAT